MSASAFPPSQPGGTLTPQQHQVMQTSLISIFDEFSDLVSSELKFISRTSLDLKA